MSKKTQLTDAQKIINAQKRKDALTIQYLDEETKEEIHIEVSLISTLKERSDMVADICDMIIGSNDVENLDASDYRPSLSTFARRCAVISYMTNLKLPTDPTCLYELVMNTSLYEDIMGAIGQDNINKVYGIFAEADEKIDFYKDIITKTFGMRKIMNVVNELSTQITERVKDINVDELKGIMENLKGVDTSNIVQTILSLNKEN